MARILLASTDVIGAAMAGPGIRAWELAHALAAEHSVTLAAPHGSARASRTVQLATYAPGAAGALAPLLRAADVVVGQGFVFETQPELLACDLPLAVDLYDPLIIESLDLYGAGENDADHGRYLALTETMLRRGDFFFCANERQRDYWLGALSALGRITPQAVRALDRDLVRLLDLVPSGVQAAPPEPRAPMLRGVHPLIGADDLVLVWAGGLWDWFDPDVVVRAVAALHDLFPQLRLCFFAGARPNPAGAPFRTRAYDRVRALAAQLGALDRSVIFLDEWVPYDERGALLREADVGVSAHLPGVETRLAFRTRLLDYLWARLPVVCTAGDSLGEELTHGGMGLPVPAGDVEAWALALRRVCTDPAWRAQCRAAAERIAPRYQWNAVATPLARWCGAPTRTAAALPGFDSTPTATEAAALARVAELEAALDERGRYIAHVEAAYARAINQAGLLGRARRLLRGRTKDG